ncbi:DUF3445 domain-containing protein [Roseobacter denitrificans]|nr:DUF3445 domain-containing protein [Roseobacter denitrificans]SFF77660.1 Protein of unknown function [Roseobacter denitrificans OCh 114]
MVEVLHKAMPQDLQATNPLPGMRPLKDGQWLRVDEAYASQMAYRRRLIAERRDDVLWQSDAACAAIAELFDRVQEKLPSLGFGRAGHQIHCPDGVVIDDQQDGALAILGKTLQEDFCILQKQGDEHVLTAAVLCFPASWTLAEKAGRPLSDIHAPVKDYTADIAKRVQRMFNAVRAEQPLWRNNMLGYADPDLFQPRREDDPDRQAGKAETSPYMRAERQCILRLPKTSALVFTIHSYVVKS